MPYWLYQNHDVAGPYTSEELLRLPSFSPRSLVCAEEQKGMSPRDWQPAETISELSATLQKPLPPSGEDLIALGNNLRRAVSDLESDLSRMRENMNLKEAEISSLRDEIHEKTASEARLNENLEEIKANLSEVSGLKESLIPVLADNQRMEARIAAQYHAIESLTGEILKLRDEIRGIQLPLPISEIQSPPPWKEVKPETGKLFFKLIVSMGLVALAGAAVYFLKLEDYAPVPLLPPPATTPRSPLAVPRQPPPSSLDMIIKAPAPPPRNPAKNPPRPVPKDEAVPEENSAEDLLKELLKP